MISDGLPVDHCAERQRFSSHLVFVPSMRRAAGDACGFHLCKFVITPNLRNVATAIFIWPSALLARRSFNVRYITLLSDISSCLQTLTSRTSRLFSYFLLLHIDWVCPKLSH